MYLIKLYSICSFPVTLVFVDSRKDVNLKFFTVSTASGQNSQGFAGVFARVHCRTNVFSWCSPQFIVLINAWQSEAVPPVSGRIRSPGELST